MNIKKLLDNNIISGLLVGIIVGTVVGVILYFLDKNYSKKIWCTQEIKSFKINDYTKTDIDVLVRECSNRIVAYNFLENMLYESNNTNKFSSIVNQLYMGKHIKDEVMINLDKSLENYLNNENYNYDDVFLSKKNNLPTLQKKINKYLLYTKEILFKSYQNSQQEIYFHIFLYLFKHDILIKDIDINDAIIYNVPNTKFTNGFPKINIEIQYLKEICTRIGKTKGRTTIIESNNIFVNILMNLFNSYKTKNIKNKLLQNLTLLSSKILNYQKNPSLNSTQFRNEYFSIMGIYPLLVEELASYSYTKKELKKIFHTYQEASKMLSNINRNVINKLVYNIFYKNKKLKLYNDFMLKAHRDNSISIDTQLIYYYAMNDNQDILNSLSSDTNISKNIKRNILHGLIIEQKSQTFYGYSDTLNIIKKIITDEKDFDNKSLLIRDALLLRDNDELIKMALMHIKENRDYYIKKLNKEVYTQNTFHFYSIFSYLAQTRPVRKPLQAEKISLFFQLFKTISNLDNKMYLLSTIQTFLDKNNISQRTQLKKIIERERDRTTREQMLSKLKF